MKTVSRFTKLSILWGTVIGIMAASGILAFGVILSWGFAGWSGRSAPGWEGILDHLIPLWLLVLNAAHFFLFPAAVATAFNSRRTPDFTELFWTRMALLFMMGGGFLTGAIAVVIIALTGLTGDIVLSWLWLLNLTNILLSSGVAVILVVSALPRENGQLVYVLCFVHLTVVAYTTVVVLFFGAISVAMGSEPFYEQADALLIWLALSAGIVALGAVNWRRIGAVFTLAGAAAIAAFAGAWFYAPPFYGGISYFGSWHPVWLSALTLLLFLVILARHYGRLR